MISRPVPSVRRAFKFCPGVMLRGTHSSGSTIQGWIFDAGQAVNWRTSKAGSSSKRREVLTRAHVGISSLLFAVTLLGCVMPHGVPQQRYEGALALVNEGTLFLRAREYSRAEAAFSMAYELAPLASALDGGGCVAFHEGRFDEAERLFRRAYDSDPSYIKALANLALLYDVTGRTEDALDLYQQVLARHPGAAYARNNLAALAYDRSGGKAEVGFELERARALLGHGIVLDNITRMGN